MAVLRVRWAVRAEDWASLDAEFPASVGATRPMLRLRLIRRNGSVQEIAAQDLGSAGAARCGVTELPLALGGDYEAELGLASEDGGWLVLDRSQRRRLTGLAVDPPAQEAGRSGAAGNLAQAPRGRAGTPALGASAAQGLPGQNAAAQAAVPGVWGLLSDDTEGVIPRSPAALPDQSEPPRADAAIPTSVAAGSETQRPGFAQGPAAAGYTARPASAAGIEVRAELVVHGRAPPGSRLDLYGRTLQVGPGGAFSLRFPVSDPDLLRRAMAAAPDADLGPAPSGRDK